MNPTAKPVPFALLSAVVLAAALSACSEKAPPMPTATTAAAPAPSAPASPAAPAAPELATQILGKWAYEYSMQLPDEGETKDQVVSVKGVNEYFPNKSLQFKGTGSYKGVGAGAKGAKNQLDIKFDVQLTSEWSITDRVVFEKTIDARMAITAFLVNGKEIKDKTVIEGLEKDMAKSFVKGETTPVKTLAIDATRWTFEQEIDKGKVIAINATRP